MTDLPHITISCSDDEHTRRIAAMLEALGYPVVREFKDGEPPEARVRALIDHVVKRHHLTEREAQVLAGFVRGKSREQLAAEFGVEVATVKWHAANVFKKTNTRRREALLRLVLVSELT